MASQAAPWSIFSQGGGNGAAVTWAEDLLKALGAPVTAGNEQFIYDWEKSEGGGGQYNPLNQGPVPGHPELTNTGQQFGGGAAGFVSVGAGIQGAVDYINMPAYAGVKSGLMANKPAAAEQALWASPWAGSHYGYGSAWNTSPLPGQASAILTSKVTPGNIIKGAVSGLNTLLPGGGITGSAIPGAGPTGLTGEIESAVVTGVTDVLGKTVGPWLLRMLFGVLGAVLIILALVIASRQSETVADAQDRVAKEGTDAAVAAAAA